MISQEQSEQIKKQILQQIESNFPEDKKGHAREQIKAMNPEQLEEFLKQNKLINNPEQLQKPQQCIFCSIISGEAQSYKIDENKDAIAVLEINPISKAHALIIPKEHISSGEKIPQSIFSLAKKIAKKIKTKFKPKEMVMSSSNLFGHEIINVLPIYENETINSERYQEKPEELEKIQNILEKKKRAKIIREPKTEKIEKERWLPKRIP